jgi:hypothetical protein
MRQIVQSDSLHPFLPIFQFCDVNHGGNHPKDDLAKFGYEISIQAAAWYGIFF